MKQRTLLFLMLVALGLLPAIDSAVGLAEPEAGPDQPVKEADTPEAYAGQMPDNDQLEVLAEHKVIAAFDGQAFHRCLGRTGLCPDRCGHSGDFANFEITDYLHYKKPGKYGDKQQETYRVQTTDFNREPTGDPALFAYVETLEKGDLVLIEWKHLYGEVRPGVKSPVRPLLLLKKIDEAEAKQLKEQAEAEREKEQGE